MKTHLRITLLGCGAALTLAGCGMTDPFGMADSGQDASGGVVAQDEALASQQDGEKSDRAALTALYEATGGKEWSRKDNWLTDKPLGDWYGVQVGSQYSGSAKGRVIRLRLPAKKLTGKIPPELGDLVHLETLWLSENELTGEIPREIGNLKELEYLWLDNNQLTGSIPPELGQLSRLKWLELHNNRLTGKIPAELGDIGYEQRGHWRTPVVLNLSGNRLRGPIPKALGNLIDLKDLALDDNRLTGKIPAELGNLKELYTLKLGKNRLTGKIPPELGGIARLDVLDLGRNRLNGRIPKKLFTFHERSCFEVLDLGGNRLQGAIPAEMGLHRWCLEELRLDDNKLTGRLPDALLKANRLDVFHFGGNKSACAPNTAAFVAWLDGIDDASGPFCDDSG